MSSAKAKRVNRKQSLAARENKAAKAIARARLAKAGFHINGNTADRVEIGTLRHRYREGERYVNVRLYIPALDIERVVDGNFAYGITLEAQ